MLLLKMFAFDSPDSVPDLSERPTVSHGATNNANPFNVLEQIQDGTLFNSQNLD